ncbi:AAA family ATPase [Acidicapsa dinghuensis]|uniref:AAA family ATPase n=1 Tax=Acidicapsa dinghuensis TaxID=2218256 RepID=A0ABW1EBN7_9BACT|nr:AAA family ATPase [Acidicapsa dinghuensis]
MRIDRIKLNNYKRFGAFEVPLDPRFNLFVGDNASGKTTILDAIQVGLDSWFIGMKSVEGIGSISQEEVHVVPHPHSDVVTFEKQFPARVEFIGTVMDREVSWSRELGRDGGRTTTVGAKDLALIAAETDQFVRAGKSVTLPLVCSYGTERLWYETPQRKRESKKGPVRRYPSRFDGYRNCTAFEIQQTDLLKWIRAEVSASQQRQSETTALSVIKDAIIGCVEDAQKVYYDERYQELIVVMQHMGHQMFSNLSDGQRVMLTLIGDLAKRAVTLNPHLEKDVLNRTPGVVTIDELDLHLHPKWQRRVIHDLKRTFPMVQFIATTHSPQLVGEALPHEIRVLEGEEATPPSRSFGIDSSRILEEVMHVSRRNEETRSLLSKMANEIDREDLGEAKKTLGEVEQKLGQADPEVTGANTLINLLETTQ